MVSRIFYFILFIYLFIFFCSVVVTTNEGDGLDGTWVSIWVFRDKKTREVNFYGREGGGGGGGGKGKNKST